jgi:hypothetical protein
MRLATPENFGKLLDAELVALGRDLEQAIWKDYENNWEKDVSAIRYPHMMEPEALPGTEGIVGGLPPKPPGTRNSVFCFGQGIMQMDGRLWSRSPDKDLYYVILFLYLGVVPGLHEKAIIPAQMIPWCLSYRDALVNDRSVQARFTYKH